VGGEDHTDSDAQNSQAVASAGKQYFVDQRAHGAFLVVARGCMCWLAAILINKFHVKSAKNPPYQSIY
jgi:hypothetical protein